MTNIISLLGSNLVPILGAVLDMTSMYILSHYSTMSFTYIVYISSMIRILFSFLGHTRWTFKGKGDSVLKSSVKFIGWEIFMMIVLVNILVILRKYMNIILSIISDRNIIGEWFVTPNPNKHPIDISNSRSSLDPDMISRKDLERLLGHKLNDTTIGEIDSDGGDLLNYDKVMYYYNSDYVYRPWVFIFLKQFLAIAMYFMIDIPVYKLIFS